MSGLDIWSNSQGGMLRGPGRPHSPADPRPQKPSFLGLGTPVVQGTCSRAGPHLQVQVGAWNPWCSEPGRAQSKHCPYSPTRLPDRQLPRQPCTKAAQPVRRQWPAEPCPPASLLCAHCLALPASCPRDPANPPCCRPQTLLLGPRTGVCLTVWAGVMATGAPACLVHPRVTKRMHSPQLPLRPVCHAITWLPLRLRSQETPRPSVLPCSEGWHSSTEGGVISPRRSLVSSWGREQRRSGSARAGWAAQNSLEGRATQAQVEVALGLSLGRVCFIPRARVGQVPSQGQPPSLALPARGLQGPQRSLPSPRGWQPKGLGPAGSEPYPPGKVGSRRGFPGDS